MGEKCQCRVLCSDSIMEAEIEFCPVHAAAFQMLAALKKLVEARDANLLSDKHRAWDLANAAIASAEQVSNAQKEKGISNLKSQISNAYSPSAALDKAKELAGWILMDVRVKEKGISNLKSQISDASSPAHIEYVQNLARELLAMLPAKERRKASEI